MQFNKSDIIAKYPFLPIAGQYIKEQQLDLEKLATDPDMQVLVDKAYRRIEAAADGKIYESKIKEDTHHDYRADDEASTTEILSFLVAIILLKLCGMNTLIQRFSLAEARRAEKYLERDLIGSPHILPDENSIEKRFELASEIIKELFSVDIQKQNGYFTIPISVYLGHSVNFHEREWKLINRRVENGLVFLSRHEIVRLFRRELTEYINSRIRSISVPTMYTVFEKPVKKLIELGKKFSVQTITSGEYPPCIKHAIEVLDKGENLSHSGRFLLATYLLSRGQTVEQIAPLFKNAPDYNEKVTLYQLNHLAGSTGNATKYSCPSCEKVKSQDLCFAIPECDNIVNPIQFGKKKTLNA